MRRLFFSKSLVSRLAEDLDSELEGWRNRPLTAESYPYPFVDVAAIGWAAVARNALLIAAAFLLAGSALVWCDRLLGRWMA